MLRSYFLLAAALSLAACGKADTGTAEHPVPEIHASPKPQPRAAPPSVEMPQFDVVAGCSGKGLGSGFRDGCISFEDKAKDDDEAMWASYPDIVKAPCRNATSYDSLRSCLDESRQRYGADQAPTK